MYADALKFSPFDAALSIQDAGALLPALDALCGDVLSAASAPSAEVLALLDESGAPPWDMAVTALTLRAALLGLRRGAAFYHHELRQRLPMPADLSPEVAMWDEGGTVPVWQGGVLTEPKYFSFFQDAPLTAFNPNHQGKWRSHELLHGAQGFYWNPQMTRFAFYLGARLNELLPVVHWWGFDEALRPRCPEHATGDPPPRRWCSACEQRAQAPLWESGAPGDAALRAAARGHLARGYEHLRQEWAACLEELEHGRRVESRWRTLDASNDAVGYMRGHWNRVTGWSFGAWIERFLVDGDDYHADMRGYFARCAATIRALLSGELTIDVAEARRRRARRVLQDVGYRALLALEHLPESINTDAALDALDRCAELAEALRGGAAPTGIDEAIDALTATLERHRARLPPPVVAALPGLGYAAPSLAGCLSPQARAALLDAAAPALQAGLAQAAPQALDAGAELAGFHAAAAFNATGTLAARFARWLPRSPALPAELATFEAWLSAPPQEDGEAELFASLPPDEAALRAGRLRANLTLRRCALSAEAAELLLGEHAEGELAILAVHYNGRPRVLALTGPVQALLDAIGAEARVQALPDDLDLDVVHELLEHGVLLWESAP